MLSTTLLCAALLATDGSQPACDQAAAIVASAELATSIDSLVEQHWQAAGVTPAPSADDATFFRRLMVDLAGRVPTTAESRQFVASTASDKRQAATRHILAGPEFPLHWGNVVDDIIQGQAAGDAEFLGYLRDALAARKKWDQIFRELMIGPWDTDESKRANRFIERRLSNLDALANDTSRVFFGVD